MVSNSSKYYGDQTLLLTIFSYVFLEDIKMFLACIAPFIKMFFFFLREYNFFNVKKVQLTDASREI